MPRPVSVLNLLYIYVYIYYIFNIVYSILNYKWKYFLFWLDVTHQQIPKKWLNFFNHHQQSTGMSQQRPLRHRSPDEALILNDEGLFTQHALSSANWVGTQDLLFSMGKPWRKSSNYTLVNVYITMENQWKSQFLIGQSSTNGPFSIAMWQITGKSWRSFGLTMSWWPEASRSSLKVLAAAAFASVLQHLCPGLNHLDG